MDNDKIFLFHLPSLDLRKIISYNWEFGVKLFNKFLKIQSSIWLELLED